MTAVRRFCGDCGTAHPLGAGFCGECGAAVAAPIAIAVDAGPVRPDAPVAGATVAMPPVREEPRAPLPPVAPAAAQPWSPAVPGDEVASSGRRGRGLVVGQVGLALVAFGAGAELFQPFRDLLSGQRWVVDLYTFDYGFTMGAASWVLALFPGLAVLGILLGRRATGVVFAMLPLYLLMVALWRYAVGSYRISGPWEWFLLAGVGVCLVAGILNVTTPSSSTRATAGTAAPTPHSSYPAGAVPSSPAGGPPTLTLIIVITLLFGVFGVIPASLHASTAQRMGYPSGRYWKAFGWCFAASMAISIIVTVAVYLAVYAAVMSMSITY